MAFTSNLKILSLFLLITLFSACIKEDVVIEPTEFTPVYSFWVGGHTYGNPNSYQYGLYPPLMQQQSFIDTFPNMRLGVLTGDIVYSPTQAYWDSALVDINAFSMAMYIAPGNHDRTMICSSSYLPPIGI